MAEVVGVVSGGIAFAEAAVGTVRGVVKLRQLWMDVKNVPRAIDDLTAQIENLDHIIWNLEQGCDDNASSSSFLSNDDEAVRKGTQYCRRTLDQFSQLVDDLTADVAAASGMSRTKAKLRVVLGKGTLAHYEQRMRDAVLHLSIAQSFYTQ